MALGYTTVVDIVDHIQNNRIVIMKSNFSPNIELIEPIDESSSVYNFKEGYHYICYETGWGEEIIKKFKEMKAGKIYTHQ